MVASLQSTAAIKLLVGAEGSVGEQLFSVDLWSGRFRSIALESAKRADCPACGLRRFEYLDAPVSDSATLCGRDAVQIRPVNRGQRGHDGPFDLKQAAERLRNCGQIQQTPYPLRCRLNSPEGVQLTLFPDGRLIVHGVADVDRARSLYARYVGS
jgi:adenylyltransferase/sulfurtransferase